MVYHVRNKTVIGIINHLSLLLGSTSLFSWIYFNVNSGIWCHRVHPNPLLMFGLVLLMVSLLGYVNTWCFRLKNKNKNLVTYVHLFCMFMLIVIIIVGTGIVLSVTRKEKPATKSKYYNIYQYSSWLRRYFFDPFERHIVRKCLSGSQACTRIGNEFKNLNASEIYKKKLSPLQSSCCLPPSQCHFEHKAANSWVMPGVPPAKSENFWIAAYKLSPYQFPDCNKWRNNPANLCYNCKSCLEGVVANLRMEWRHLAMINICVLVFVIIVHSIRWFITRNIELDHKYGG